MGNPGEAKLKPKKFGCKEIEVKRIFRLYSKPNW
jgi:hypothetical protein